jgi:hypothetical protein
VPTWESEKKGPESIVRREMERERWARRKTSPP